MNATIQEKVQKAMALLAAAGVAGARFVPFTNGGGVIKGIKVFQDRKERECEITFGEKIEGSKYSYLLPNGLCDQIESL